MGDFRPLHSLHNIQFLAETDRLIVPSIFNPDGDLILEDLNSGGPITLSSLGGGAGGDVKTTGPEVQDALVVYDPATGTKTVKGADDGAPVLFSDLFMHDGSVQMSGNMNLGGFSIISPVKTITNVNDTIEMFSIENTGANAGKSVFRVSDRNPFGVVTGDPGDLFIRSDVDGRATFYLNDGQAAANTQWADMRTPRGVTMHTGIRKEGLVTIAGASTVSISTGNGDVLDTWTDPDNPVPTRIEWATLGPITLTGIATTERTFIGIQVPAAGDGVALITDVVQLATATSNFDHRRYILLAVCEHFAGVLTAVTQFGQALYEQDMGFHDFMRLFGVINAEGNDFSAGTANTQGLDVDAGNMFYPDIGRDGTIAGRQNPNETSQLADIDATFLYVRGDGTPGGITVEDATATDIDVVQFDDGAGALATLSNNTFKVDKIFRHPDGRIAVEYGTIQFSNFSDANAGIDFETTLLRLPWLWRFALIIAKNETDNNNNVFVERNAVGGGSGGGGGGGGGGGDFFGPAGGVSAGELVGFGDATGKLGAGTGIQGDDVILRTASVDFTSPPAGPDGVAADEYVTVQQLNAAADPTGTAITVVTRPHSVRTNAAGHIKLRAAGTIDQLDLTVPVPTDATSGPFSFEVFTGPSGGPYVTVGVVTVAQGQTEGTVAIGPIHAYDAGDVFKVDCTAVGVMPAGTPSWQQRFFVHVRTTNT